MTTPKQSERQFVTATRCFHQTLRFEEGLIRTYSICPEAVKFDRRARACGGRGVSGGHDCGRVLEEAPRAGSWKCQLAMVVTRRMSTIVEHPACH